MDGERQMDREIDGQTERQRWGGKDTQTDGQRWMDGERQMDEERAGQTDGERGGEREMDKGRDTDRWIGRETEGRETGGQTEKGRDGRGERTTDRECV